MSTYNWDRHFPGAPRWFRFGRGGLGVWQRGREYGRTPVRPFVRLTRATYLLLPLRREETP